jgi:gliding motility-associated lipoprotein GldH
MNVNKISTLIIFGITLLSCDPNRVIDKTKEIPENIWNKNEKISFMVPVADTISSYNVFFNLRHKAQYPYRNIIFFLEIYSPQGKLVKDKVEFMLADKKGKWRGSGLGGVFDTKLLYKKNIRFAKAGTYKFVLVHGMRKDKLPHIMDVGLRVEKIKSF